MAQMLNCSRFSPLKYVKYLLIQLRVSYCLTVSGRGRWDRDSFPLHVFSTATATTATGKYNILKISVVAVVAVVAVKITPREGRKARRQSQSFSH